MEDRSGHNQNGRIHKQGHGERQRGVNVAMVMASRLPLGVRSYLRLCTIEECR